MDTNKGKAKLIYPELSYKVVGILYDVYNQLGSSYQEKYYQRAVEKALQDEGISFQREKFVPLEFKDKRIGKHFVDFVIEDKIVLELKKTNKILLKDVKQVLMYLRSTGLPLGIVVAITRDKLVYRRVLNREVLPPIRSDSDIRDNLETIGED